jgi:hypothetical protein
MEVERVVNVSEREEGKEGNRWWTELKNRRKGRAKGRGGGRRAGMGRDGV